jgi:hypothetical protein
MACTRQSLEEFEGQLQDLITLLFVLKQTALMALPKRKISGYAMAHLFS